MIRKLGVQIELEGAVLVPGKIKWLENDPSISVTRDRVLVPGKIKWLENNHFYSRFLQTVLVPGKIKWLENVFCLLLEETLF